MNDEEENALQLSLLQIESVQNHLNALRIALEAMQERLGALRDTLYMLAGLPQAIDEIVKDEP